MPRSLLKSAVLGGLVVFIWSLISWMVLPIHQHCFHQFTNEERVASVIREHAPGKDLYEVVTMPEKCGCSKNEGFYMFAAVVPKGLGQEMTRPLVCAFVIQVIGAFLVSWMLIKTKGLSFRHKVLFVTLFGLGIGVLGSLSAWNWANFSACYVLTQMFDLVVGWCLAGLVIAKTLKGAK
ncbi:MAG: hypothetical protein RLZZ453_913 [Chlamydiota bacterium]